MPRGALPLQLLGRAGDLLWGVSLKLKGGYLIMQHGDIKYFQDMLTCWLEDLLKQGDNTVKDFVNSTIKAVDPVDQASLDTDRDFRIRIRDRESRLIGKIKQSLGRIEDGTFGICEACGEEISIDRLRARPVATYCIACKNKMEALENQ